MAVGVIDRIRAGLIRELATLSTSRNVLRAFATVRSSLGFAMRKLSGRRRWINTPLRSHAVTHFTGVPFRNAIGSTFLQSLSRYGSGILVWSQAHKSDVADVIGIRPLEEFEIGDKFGPNPDAISHLLGSESLTPSATVRFRQI